MRVVFLAAILFALFNNACTDLWKDQSKRNENSRQKETPCTARYVPVGNNPEIALDTQTGTLCRTIADTNDPLGIRDPACGVSQQQRNSGFVPSGCKADQTWVKGEGGKNPSRYTSLPVCSKVIVVTPEDMK